MEVHELMLEWLRENGWKCHMQRRFRPASRPSRIEVKTHGNHSNDFQTVILCMGGPGNPTRVEVHHRNTPVDCLYLTDPECFNKLGQFLNGIFLAYN